LAATTVTACLLPKESLVPGGYYAGCKPATASKIATDAEIARKLWEKSDQLCAEYLK